MMSETLPERAASTPARRYREAGGVFAIALALFSWLSIRSDATGQAGYYLRLFLRAAFGQGAHIPLLILLICGLELLWPRFSLHRGWLRLIGLGGLTAVLLGSLHLRLDAGALLGSLSYQELLWYGRQGLGGGVSGALISIGLIHFFGSQGTYIVLVVTTIISLMFLTELSPGRLPGLVFDGAARVWEFLRLLPSRFINWSRAQEEESLPVEQGDEAPVRRAVRRKPRGRKKKAEPSVPVSTNQGGVPSLDLLSGDKRGPQRPKDEPDQRDLVVATLESFGIQTKVVSVSRGPVITRYELEPPPGIKVSRIVGLTDDISLSLATAGVRVEAPVPGKSVVGIEVPNKERGTVHLREVLEAKEFQRSPSPVTIALGKDVAGKPVVTSMDKLPHLLIAGATGSGKSVCINTIIASLLFKASHEELKLLLVDPKRVELSGYEGIPHLFCPVVTDPKKAATALRWMVGEMEKRYQQFATVGVRNIDGYNERARRDRELEFLPRMVVIVDELADLMLVAGAEVEEAICRLAQMARAAGIYLIIATQRPSVDVITGLIKANIPSRIAFAVSSQIDSRTILDMAGAERLLGKGDMLFHPVGASKPLRVQGAFISDQEVEDLIAHWKAFASPEYIPDVLEEDAEDFGLAEMDDELFADAVRLVVDIGQASASMLQRRFRIGYARAARLIDMMEIKGVIGGHQGSKPREVLWQQEDVREYLNGKEAGVQ